MWRLIFEVNITRRVKYFDMTLSNRIDRIKSTQIFPSFTTYEGLQRLDLPKLTFRLLPLKSFTRNAISSVQSTARLSGPPSVGMERSVTASEKLSARTSSMK